MNLSLIDIQKRLLPEFIPVMQRRFDILQYIGLMEPVGRRSLSINLGITERVLRGEVTLLKDQNLLSVASIGMKLTPEGREVLEGLRPLMREFSGFSHLEKQLQKSLGVKRVWIVPGDSDESEWVKSELGRACVTCMKEILKGENIIAVTGGTTMAAVAERLNPDIDENILFVPARGGIGEDVKNQANTICARMAEKSGKKHRVLYVPDQLSNETFDSIVKEPEIHEVLTLIKSAEIVLHGIGNAITMAKRRNTSAEDIEKLKSQQAISEAFGYYFNEAGEAVHKVQTVGLQLDDLDRVNHVIAVAGGASKAKAIRSYMKQAKENTILITDEGAAKGLL